MTFAGFHGHGSIRTVWKALEFDRRQGGLSNEKGQTEKREQKRKWSHVLFLLLIYPRGFTKPLEGRGPDADQSPVPN